MLRKKNMNSSVILIKIQWIDLSFFYVCFYSAFFVYFWLFGPKKNSSLHKFSLLLFGLLTILLCFSKFFKTFFAIKNYHNRIITPLLCYVLSIQSNWEFFKENCYWKILLFSESKLMKNKSYQNDIQNKYKYSIQLVLLTYNFNLRVFLVCR